LPSSTGGKAEAARPQFLELALESDPGYHLARLSDQMIGSGMTAGWSMDKGTAYRDRGLEAS